MNELGRGLVGIGLLIVAVGALVLLAGKIGLPLGRMPGDFVWRGKRSAFYFPLATCLLISALLMLVLFLLGRFRR